MQDSKIAQDGSGTPAAPPAEASVAAARVEREPLVERSASPGRGRAIVVAGMHRSGTSALTQLLIRLGFSGPKTPVGGNASNPDGHFEPLPIARFNDEILKSCGSEWSDWRPLAMPGGWQESEPGSQWVDGALRLLGSEYQGPSFVLKEPRISRIGPVWRRVLEGLPVPVVFVQIIRNPLEVAQSLVKRNDLSLTHGLLLWLRYVLDAEETSRGFARTIVTYGQLQADWRAVMDRVRDVLGVPFPLDPQHLVAENFVPIEPTLRHHRSTRSDLEGHPEAPDLVKRCYKVLLGSVDSGAITDAQQTELAEIRAEFDRACGVFRGAYRDVIAATNPVRTDLAAVTAERDKLIARMAETEQVSAAQARAIGEAMKPLKSVAERLHTAGDSFSNSLAALRDDQEEVARRIAEERQTLLHEVQSALRRQEENNERLRDGLVQDLRNLKQVYADQTEQSRQSLIEELVELVTRQTELKDATVEPMLTAIVTLTDEVRRSDDDRRRTWALAATARALLQMPPDPRGGGLFRRRGTALSIFNARQLPAHFTWRELKAIATDAELFNADWYLDKCPAASEALDPFVHYLETAVESGIDPSPNFSTRRYLEINRDVRDAGLNPLWHYLMFGQFDGRRVS